MARADGANVGEVILEGSEALIEADRPSPDSRLYGEGEGEADAGPGELSIRALATPIAAG